MPKGIGNVINYRIIQFLTIIRSRIINYWSNDGLNGYNPYGDNEILKIDASNFEINAKITLWGCNAGRIIKGVDPIAQIIANHLDQGGSSQVRAHDNYTEHKTQGGDGKNIIYDGTMIRSQDRASQKVNLKIFKPK